MILFRPIYYKYWKFSRNLLFWDQIRLYCSYLYMEINSMQKQIDVDHTYKELVIGTVLLA